MDQQVSTGPWRFGLALSVVQSEEARTSWQQLGLSLLILKGLDQELG